MTNRIDDNLMHFHANESLVRALLASGARFLVIGGLAISWHCRDRTADDMDLLVEPTAENSERIASALASLGLNGFSNHSFAMHGVQVPLKKIHYAELLTPRHGDATYSEIDADAVSAALFNMPVRLASIASLIIMKKALICSTNEQRVKHVRDITLLEMQAMKPI
jgi:hypothetical protein